MAINIKNYVDISTTFPSANSAVRSFGGLVITASGGIFNSLEAAEEAGMGKFYETLKGVNQGMGVCTMTLEQVGLFFGKVKTDAEGKPITDADGNAIPTDEYEFARRYYSYISPSGTIASQLMFALLGDDTPVEAFERINAATNDFGSFTFLATASSMQASGSSAKTWNELLLDVAKKNHELDTKYLFVVNMPQGETYNASNAVTDCNAFTEAKYEGTNFVYGADAVAAYMPMAILASTNYTSGQVVNFMFKQFSDGDSEVVVFDDLTYRMLNKNLVNFYGQSQTNGQTLNFFQRGFNTDGVDTAIYCNEMWFKAACETSLMNFLVTKERLPADALGVDLVKLQVVDVCSDATSNGTFMAKQLTKADLKNVREIVINAGGDTGDVESIEADVSTKGYSVYAYLDIVNPSDMTGKDVEKAIRYYVFYGTADSVRYIKGNDILLK